MILLQILEMMRKIKMRFTPAIEEEKLPIILEKFFNLTGPEPWVKRFNWLSTQLNCDFPLPEFIAELYRLEIALLKILKHYSATGVILPEILSPPQRQLLSFVTMVVLSYESLNSAGQKRLKGMLSGSLRIDRILGPLSFELGVATHLMSKGFDIFFNDLENNGGFDYLATRGDAKLEVECKYISGDIGKQIHRKELYQFARYVAPLLDLKLNTLEVSVVIKLQISARLCSSKDEHRNLFQVISNAIDSGEKEFEFSGSRAYVSKIVNENIESIFESISEGKQLNFDALPFDSNNVLKGNSLIVRKNGRVIIVSIESKKQDKALSQILQQLKDCTKNQFSGNRPALLCVQLSDFNMEQILSLKELGGTGVGLDHLVTKLIYDRPQLFSIAFVGLDKIEKKDKDLELQEGASEGVVGATYLVKNPSHPFANDSRYSVY